MSGHLEIELTGPNVRHITQVPIPPTNFPEILIMSTHERVGYIRSLAARLG